MFSGGPHQFPPNGGGNGNTSSFSAHHHQQQQEQANNNNSVVEDSADDDGIFDPNMPGFTDEEAWREIQSLTAQEIAAVQADLIGLSTTMGALNIGGRGGGSAAAAAAAAAAAGTARIGRAGSAGGNAGAAILNDTNVTARIHAEINRLPSGETAAYRQAVQLCPDQVMDPRRVQMFLNYAAEEEKQQQQQLPGVTTINGSNTAATAATTSDACVRHAAQKMAKYWKVREKIFNGAHPSTAFLPMTQAGALTAAGAMNLATRRVYELLPTTDTSGRSVLCFAPHRRDYTQHTVYQDLAGFWYLIETVMEDPEKRKEGIVLLVEAGRATMAHGSREVLSAFLKILSALPIAIKAVHFCYPSGLQHHFIIPIFKRFVLRKLRLRTVVHYGTTNEVLTSLSGYCLPSDRVPTDLGGKLVLNSTASMLNRMAIETVRMNPSIGSLIQQNDTELQNTTSTVAMGLISGAATATAACGSNNRTVQVESTNKSKQPPEVDRHPNLSDLQVYNKLMELKKSKKQRGDPRMNQALAVCLEDADQSHLDVLLQCGFDFSPLSREELKLAGSRDVKDVENITLKQRLDQLSRRLRIAKEWVKREREEGKVVSTSIESTEQMQTESSDNDSKINDKPERNIGAGSGRNNAQKRRQDSFDDAIDELPGMEGLGDTLVDMLSDDEI